VSAVAEGNRLLRGQETIAYEDAGNRGSANGFWLAITLMALTTLGSVVFFWRKRYLKRSAR
jgi:hypothetical protein